MFFTLPTDQARPQVAQFLLLSMAPFAIVAPFIGPFLDRFRHGRRWALGVSLALRAFLCWVLASVLDGSTWLFLCALVFLVASKAFTITRAAAVPRLLPPGFTLVNANSRISMANVLGAAVGGGIAAGIALLGPEWSLRFGFLIFVAATVFAILLSPAVDSLATERDTSSVPTGPAGQLPEATRISRRFRDLQPGVLHGLRCVMGARLMTGFLTFFLAFLLREQPIASIDGVLLLGIVVAAAGVGNSLGTIVGNLSKNIAPEKIGLAVLCVDLAIAIITAALYSIVTVIALGLIAGLCAQLAKLGLRRAGPARRPGCGPYVGLCALGDRLPALLGSRRRPRHRPPADSTTGIRHPGSTALGAADLDSCRMAAATDRYAASGRLRAARGDGGPEGWLTWV